MSQVTVQALDDLIKQWKEKEDEVAVITETEIKPRNADIARLKSLVANHLAELDRLDYVSPFGKVKSVEVYSVKMPADVAEKAKLWAWMRERGIYDAYATVHATALKSLFMSERELAVKNGEDPVTFALPGMEPAKLFEDVKLTKK